MMAKVVGMIGLGIMGGAMARNLVRDGWRVLGFDTDPGRRTELAADGVEAVASPVEAARTAEVLITSLPSPAAVLATARALAESGLPKRVVVECSTLSIADKLAVRQVLADAGHEALDVPISGTGSQAVNKDLVLYASGESATIEALRPLFAGFARATHDLGAYGNGSRMKFVANLLVAINNVASAEAMVLGIKAGLDPAQVVQLVQAGAANSRVFELRAPMMAAAEYLPATMKCAIWQKDMDVIGHFATELGVPTPLFSATLPVYAAAMAQGHGADDTAAVCAVLEAMAGLPKRG
jgi:putative dehydrogenase